MEALPKYTLYRTNRKNIRLVLRSNGALSVYCPKRCPLSEIEAMIVRNYPRLSSLHNSKADTLFTSESETDTLPYMGKRYPIYYKDVAKLIFDGEAFTAPIGHEKEKIRAEYVELLRKCAKLSLPSLVKKYAELYGFKYNSVRIKSTSSRYGSCSSKGNINLSLTLMACDTEFIKFVILHELCHTVHMNHSESFYALLSKVCPEHKLLNDRGEKCYSKITAAINYRPCP